MQNLLNKKYAPWWTLFLIEQPYYPTVFRKNLTWLIEEINNLFTNGKADIKQQLINAYSNDELANQIINEYYKKNDILDENEQSELSKILDTSLNNAYDRSQKELIQEIKKNVITNLPFGKILITTAGLSFIIGSYLAKAENKHKPVSDQAIELIHIIGKVCVKGHAIQVTKSIIPGVCEIVDAVVSVTVSPSSPNPLHTDKKIGQAIASAAGGVLGGAIGTTIPVIGTYAGGYMGAILTKTAVTLFYNVLEAWQKAPKGPGSIIPGYPKSMWAVIDNDAANILEPLYLNYLETERKSKELGNEIAKWISIYAQLQNSGADRSHVGFEIIDEEMRVLKVTFDKLKDSHSRVVRSLYTKIPDNCPRIREYKAQIKTCLAPLYHPITGMLDEYFSYDMAATPKSNGSSYEGILRDLPAVSFAEDSMASSPIIKKKQSVFTEQNKSSPDNLIFTHSQSSDVSQNCFR